MSAPAYLGDALAARVGEFVTLRRDLHAHPELGFEEHRTAALVAAKLADWGYEVFTGIGGTGVVGRLVRGSGSKRLGLRADMDALPIQEDSGRAWASRSPGLMHGCGHDGHTTMLLGAARHLAATRAFDGTAHLIFQPGEEGFAGGRAMVEDGLFERFPCDAVYAMHNWPGLPAGHIAMRPGPIMAAADRVTIKVVGRGGHGAHAYLAVDPVVVAAHIITATQSVVSRNVPPLESAVVSLCGIEAGNLGAMSVIPGEATVVGTVRTFNPAVQDLVEARLRALVESIAAGFGATASLHYERIYPATVNSTAEAAFGLQVATELVGAEGVVPDLEPSMGAEDFSFMLQQRPGAYFRIGQAGGPSCCFLHNSRYDFNDEILPLGAALFARLVERSMPLSRGER